MIQDFKPYIEKLLLNEPWRSQPRMDASPCSGHLEWDGSRFWLCGTCGRIGNSSMPMHLPAESPARVARIFFKKLAIAVGHRLLSA